VRDGDLSGTVETQDASSIRVAGDAKGTTQVLIDRRAGTLRFGGAFDGVLEVGSADKGLAIGGTLGPDADVSILDDAKSISLGGTDAGSVVSSGGYVGSLSVGTTHSGVFGSRLGLGTANLMTVVGGLVSSGFNTKSLNVRGASTDGAYVFGVWFGADRSFNTSDDVLTGGTLGSATFGGTYSDSVLSAGVLPSIDAVSTNVQGRPDDNRAFTGNPAAADFTLVDGAESGGVARSEIGRVSIRGLVSNTSAATGRLGVIASANGVGSLSGGPTISAIARRAYGDPVGMPQVLDSIAVNDSRIDLIFSEPINTASFVLAVDADGNGSLLDPVDTRGTVIVADADTGELFDDLSLGYDTFTTPDGDVRSALRISRAGGFTETVTVALTAPLVEQEGFADTPTIFDRSGLRNVLRDFNQDGVKETGRDDRLGTILDGDGDGVEGGDFGLLVGFGDVADTFSEALLEPEVFDPAGPAIQTLDVNQIFDSAGDIDMYRFTANAFDFFSVAYVGDPVVSLAVFVLDDQATIEGEDDSFEMLARHEVTFIEGFQAYELPETSTYFVAVVPEFIDPEGSNTYDLTLTLSPTDDELDGVDDDALTLPPDEVIAYVSNAIGDNNNELGANEPKQLIYLNFDGGTSTKTSRGDVDVMAFDASTLNPLLAGLEDDLINGGTGIVGILDRMVEIYTDTPASHPDGMLNVQIIGADLTDFDAATDGLFFTTADPALLGRDPDIDFSTVFIGQTDAGGGGQGIASTVDFANMSKADEALIFIENFGVFNSGSGDATTVANRFVRAIANTTAHETGHFLGLNHTELTLLADDPDNDPMTDDDSNQDIFSLISAGPNIFADDDFPNLVVQNLFKLGTGQIETGELDEIQPTQGRVDQVANLLRWLK